MTVRLHDDAIAFIAEVNRHHYIEYVDITQGEDTVIVMVHNTEAEVFSDEFRR